MATCKVDACNRTSFCRGYCRPHYDEQPRIIRKRNSGTIGEHGHIIVRVGHQRNKGLHVIIVETLLGRELPKGTVIHHIDGNPANNSKDNLLVCPSQSYHQLIEQRTRAVVESGHADWFKCVYCKSYDAPANLIFNNKRRSQMVHRECKNAYSRDNARKNYHLRKSIAQ